MIKVILLDIDGTLTNSKKEITPLTKKVLLKAQDMGIRLALASGRTDQGLLSFADKIDMRKHHGIFVCYNGAKVMDCQTGEVYYEKPMSAEEGKAVLEHLKKFDVIPIVARGEYMYTNDVFSGMIRRSADSDEVFNVIQYESRSNGYLLCEKKDMAAFADFEIEKILTAGDPAYLQEHYTEMREPFKDTLSSMFTAPFYYEFTAKDVDKGTAIDTAFRALGYTPDEMIAFGDAENDIPMLSYAGIGVAMANATQPVLDMADEVTLSNEEDGVAHSLLKHIPELGD